MKIRRNKINRGLVLGAVLLLGLTCFIIIKEVSFKSEKPLIADTVQEYIEKLAALSVAEDGAVPGHKLTEAQKKARLGLFDALTDEYWLGNVSERDISGEPLEKTRQDYIDCWLSGVIGVEYTDIDVPQSEIEVTSDGPDRAKAELRISGIVAEYNGIDNGNIYSPFLHSGTYIYYELDEGEYFTEKYRAVYDGDIEFELERSGGKWRIISVSSYIWTSSVIKKGEQTDG